MKTFQTQSPITEQILAEYSLHTPEEVEAKLQMAKKAQQEWKKSQIADRVNNLAQLRHRLLEQKEKWATLIQQEMGKHYEEALAEVEKCASCAEYYEKNAEQFLSPIAITTDASKSYIAFEPLGIVLSIMPWNFPFWQAFRCAIPAILSGNAIILKHASNVSGCALAIEKIFSCFPQGIFQTVLLSGSSAQALISKQEISAVSFTGSTSVGKKIASTCGAHLKKAVLELGGSDPYIVLADADVSYSAKICAHSRLINAGQSCIAAKRFIVEKSILATFEKNLLHAMTEKNLAPMARGDLREELHKQVIDSVQMGAKILCGGEIPSSKGFFYPPTILTNVQKGMPAYEEELFGPVASIICAQDADDAISIANSTVFGLGAAIFTSPDTGELLAKNRIDAGSCFVNTFVRSDPRLPFGGIKNSGFGRELSEFGMREFTNIKTIWVEKKD